MRGDRCEPSGLLGPFHETTPHKVHILSRCCEGALPFYPEGIEWVNDHSLLMQTAPLSSCGVKGVRLFPHHAARCFVKEKQEKCMPTVQYCFIGTKGKCTAIGDQAFVTRSACSG